MPNVDDLTLSEAAEGIASGELKPSELLEAFIERIKALNSRINAVITLAEEARREAREADREVGRKNPRRPLHGIPVLIKDTVCTKGIRTTAGSLILKDFVPDHDATVVGRLKKAGAIIMGKAHTHEFALAGTSINPHYGPCRNPWDVERIPGGSSGGSAAAVASGMALLATGSDSAGSIRIPASFCGVVGLKPTYGSVSRYGVIPHSWTLCHVGPITKTVEDAALAFNVMRGYDARDPSSIRRRTGVKKSELRRTGKLKIGVPEDLLGSSCDPEVERVFRSSLGKIEECGFEIITVNLPLIRQYSASTRVIIERCEVSSYHDEYYSKYKELYGDDVRLMIEVGQNFSAVDYIRALRVRTLIIQEFRSIMKEKRLDALVTPTVPTLPFKISDIRGDAYGYSVKYGPVMTLYTAPFTLIGAPAVSVNSGFAGDLPVGLQIVGRFFDEGTILRIGKAVEDLTPHRKPPLP